MNTQVRYFTKARVTGQVGSTLIDRAYKDSLFEGKTNPDYTDPNFIVWWEEEPDTEEKSTMKYLFKLMKKFNSYSAKGKEEMVAHVIALLANMLEEYINSYPEENTQAKQKLHAHLMSILKEE